MPAPKLDDDRALRRDLTCVATGLLAGGGLGVVAAALISAGGIALAVAGAVVGGLIGKATARRISADDWDPSANLWRRPYVGANSPDDDVASGAELS